MINTIIRCLGAVILFLEQLKGQRVIKEIHHPHNAMGYLAGYSISGYSIQIFCQRKHYRRYYDNWFIPNQDHIAYHVYSVVSSDAPDVLKQACELDLDIPALLPSAVSDEGQREEAVKAYLDLLIERLGPCRDLADQKGLKVSVSYK